MREFKHTISVFADEMHKQLMEKSTEKRPHHDCTNLYLMTELEKQIEKIKYEMDPIEAAKHCIHVGNFAMLIRNNLLIRGF